MNYKQMIAWLPLPMTIGLVLTNLISGLTGIWIAEVFGRIARFNQGSTQLDVLQYSLFTFGGVLFFCINSVLLDWLKSHAVKVFNVKVKKEFINYSINNKVGSTTPVSEQISFLINDFKLLEQNYFQLIFSLIFYLGLSLFSVIYLLQANFILGCLFAASAFFAMIPPWIWQGVLERLADSWSKANAIFLQKASDLFEGLITIKTYGVGNKIYHNVKIKLLDTENMEEKLNNNQDNIETISEALSNIGLLLPIVVGMIFILNGMLEATVIISMYYARDTVAYPLRFASQYVNRMNTTKGIRQKIGLIIEENANYCKEKINKLEEPNISFQDVTFGYEKDTELLNINQLEIPYGEKILISGDSGSGKTTLLDLLQGNLVPDEGAITLYDKKGSRMDSTAKNNIFARIGQEPYIFSETLMFNLTLGHSFEEEDIYKVLEDVGLLEELGVEPLDQTFGERGSKLSGGQRQRVEIARALLHDKQIILVDEATSALDNESAKKVRDLIWRLPQTVIEIAHHFDEEDLINYDIKHYRLENKQIIE